jgi:chromosome partitioning protein
MRVIAFVSDEKGVGKSLLAHRLAESGMLADGRPAVVVGFAPDPAPGPRRASRLVVAEDAALIAHLESLHAEGAGIAIIDLPTAAADPVLAAVLPWVDLVLIPVLPRRARLARLGSLVKRIEAEGAPFAFVVNQASPRHTLTGAYAMALAQHGTVCPVAIPRDPSLAAPGDATDAAPIPVVGDLARFIDRLLVRICGTDDTLAAPAAVERRQFRRWPLDWEAMVEQGDDRCPCRLIDLSGGGAGFECQMPLAQGDSIHLDVPGLGRFAATVVAAFDGRVGARLALDAERQWQLATQLAIRMQAAAPPPDLPSAESPPVAEDRPAVTVAGTADAAVAETATSDLPAVPTADDAAPVSELPAALSPLIAGLAPVPPATDRLRSLNQALALARPRRDPGRLIVVGNEKGGSGKSTVAVHLLIALLKDGFDVASIDLDGRQATLSRYLDNRRQFAAEKGLTLAMPAVHQRPTGDESDLAFSHFLTEVSAHHDFVIVDTPGRDARLARLAHLYADVVVTPLNDSFLDLDVLGRVDAQRRFAGCGPYGALLADARRERAAADGSPDWIVLRNRLTTVRARNKAEMAKALDRLAPAVGFRVGPGLTERVIYRELFPCGLTLLDVRDDGVGVPLTLSHLAARQELRSLVRLVLAGGGDRPLPAMVGGATG